LDPSAGVVLHQPLASGPCPPFSPDPQNGPKYPILAKNAQIWVFPRKSGKKAVFGHFSPFSGFWARSGKMGDRAPPRGVDVKPPPRRGPDSGKGSKKGWEPLLGAWEPPGEPSGASPGPREGSGTPGTRVPRSRPPARGLFYINPSRRGPAPGAGRRPPIGVWRVPLHSFRGRPEASGRPPDPTVLLVKRLTTSTGRSYTHKNKDVEDTRSSLLTSTLRAARPPPRRRV